MPRRTTELLPLEINILMSGTDLQGSDGFYGFQLAKHVRARAGEAALTGHGTLYKALSRLATRGLLETWWEDPGASEAEGRPRRRMYRLTGAGEVVVRSEVERRHINAAARPSTQRQPGLA